MGIKESVNRTVNKCPCVKAAKARMAKRAAMRIRREERRK